MLEENLFSVGANAWLRRDPFHTHFKRTFQKTARDTNRDDYDSWRHVCVAESASVNKGLTKTLICDLSRTLKDVSIFIEFSMRDKNCPNLNRDLEISVARSCPILCEPLDCNPPGTFVHGILQARRLEWVAMPPSRGIFPTQGWNPHLLHWQADPLSSEPYGKPKGGGGLGDTPHIPPCLLGSVPGSLLSRSGDGSWTTETSWDSYFWMTGRREPFSSNTPALMRMLEMVCQQQSTSFSSLQN